MHVTSGSKAGTMIGVGKPRWFVTRRKRLQRETHHQCRALLVQHVVVSVPQMTPAAPTTMCYCRGADIEDGEALPEWPEAHMSKQRMAWRLFNSMLLR